MSTANKIVNMIITAVLSAVIVSCTQQEILKDDSKHAFIGTNLWSAHLDNTIEDAVLLVNDGKVVDVFAKGSNKIPLDYHVTDLNGSWIIPGLVSAHAHVMPRPGFHIDAVDTVDEAVQEQLDLYARYGVTTIFSMGNEPEEAFNHRDVSQSEDYNSARLFLAGKRIEVYSINDASAIIQKNLEKSPDYIKIAVDNKLGKTEKMSEDIYSAVIEIAKQNGLFVSAHLIELEDAKGLIRAGVGFLAHSIRDQIVDDELIDLMKQNEICISPTLMREVSVFAFAKRPDFMDDPLFTKEAHPEFIERAESPATQKRYKNPTANWARETSLPNAQVNMMKLHEAGVIVVMGPDSGPGLRPQGFQERMEMEMMEKAGMSPEDVLKASTYYPAKCLKNDQTIGTLEKGKWADFLVLSDDPLKTVKSLRSLERVYIGGKLFHETSIE